MKLKDILIIAGAILLSFPIVLGITMTATGFMKLSFGWEEKNKETKEEVDAIKWNHKQDSMMIMHSKSLQALESQREELQKKAADVKENEERLLSLQQEIANRNNDLQKTRAQIEALVNKSAEMEDRRLKQLAGVYASMRAEEAAPILYTLKDDMIVSIMEKITDNRQKAKLMAAFGNINKERAGEISRRMGIDPMQKTAKGKNS
jgi:flagellar motility protein MotE (MotC chaperone)